jgi:hypothetical protein
MVAHTDGITAGIPAADWRARRTADDREAAPGQLALALACPPGSAWAEVTGR